MGSQKRDRGVLCFTTSKLPVEMTVVAVMRGKMENRGLQLIEPVSRTVKKHEIHELILTDQQQMDRKQPVHRIAYLAFVEVIKGGIAIVGDDVHLGARRIGSILGFDDSHVPNHQNIIVSSEKRKDGVQLGFELGATVTILAPPQRGSHRVRGRHPDR